MSAESCVLNSPETPAAQAAPVAAKSRPPSQHILVVEDDQDLRQLYLKVLARAGYKVDTAVDGDVGWKVLQAASYDLLITDNNMPKLTGVELIKKLRHARLSLPVILASGAAPINIESLQLTAILPKPFTIDELKRTVQEALNCPVVESTPPTMKKFARRLLAYEAASGKPTDAQASAAFRVCEKMRGPLSKLMGLAGFRSLLYRALTLAGAEVTWLLALEIETDGTLEGLDELETNLDRRTATEGEAAFVAQLLGLLVALIGTALTLRMMHQIWPKMDDLNF